jgi:hypothetical protein
MIHVLSSPYDAVLYGDMLIHNCSSALSFRYRFTFYFTRPKEKKVRLTDILYIFELIKRQRTGMNRLKIVDLVI